MGNSRPNEFSYRGEKVECDGPVRQGFCERCKRRVGIAKTMLHHFWYDPYDKLRFAIEVCFKCHCLLDDNFKYMVEKKKAGYR